MSENDAVEQQILDEAVNEALQPDYEVDAPSAGPYEFTNGLPRTPCLRGVDLVGSVPQLGSKLGQRMSARPSVTQGRVQFTSAKSPYKGRGHTVMSIPKIGRLRTNAATVDNARAAAKYAMQIADKLDKLVKRAAKQGIHGAVPTSHKSPQHFGHPKLTLAQVKKLVADLRAQAQKTQKAADKHDTVYKTRQAQVVKGVKAAAALLNPRHGVHGIAGEEPHPFDDVVDTRPEAEILGEEAYILGQLCESLIGDDPSLGQPTDASDSSYADPNAGRYPGPDTNYGMPPAPTADDAKKAYMDPANFQTEVGFDPDGRYQYATVDDLKAGILGAVPFTFDLGSAHQPPFKAITSWNTNNPRPGVEGGQDSDGVGAGFEWHGTEGSRWFVYFPRTGTGPNTIPVVPPSSEEASNLDVMYDHSIGHGWGGIFGNGKGANTRGGVLPDDTWKGLRYAYGSGSTGQPFFFWHRDAAPEWATLPEINVLYNQLLTDWNAQFAAAKANYAAQVAQDMADAQAAAAAAKQQNAENAAAAHQADLAALADQTAQQQLATQQQQADLQAQQQAQQLDAQRGQLDLDEERADLQAYQQWLQQGGGDAPDGGGFDQGGFDDQGGDLPDDGGPNAEEAELEASDDAGGSVDDGDL